MLRLYPHTFAFDTTASPSHRHLLLNIAFTIAKQEDDTIIVTVVYFYFLFPIATYLLQRW